MALREVRLGQLLGTVNVTAIIDTTIGSSEGEPVSVTVDNTDPASTVLIIVWLVDSTGAIKNEVRHSLGSRTSATFQIAAKALVKVGDRIQVNVST
ncbi:hypothetical protein [Nocardioides sp.]|uniref:hypothetical protein n=1 Tax=Nocardioides sp. TaxID=35761 RepID=UPI002B61A488|nr:hypothetical protein [Nocardioides sp.]HXH79940.1 hypothetical protein [Nocardioides sp.]